MSGENFKSAFQHFYSSYGQVVTIIRNYGFSEESSFELRALKNNKKGRPDDVMFQFPEAVDIRVDDIIRLKQGRDLWKVYDVEDKIIGEIYVNFEAKVVKVNPSGIELTKNKKEHTIFNAPIYGGVQVGGQNNYQEVSVNIQNEIDKILSELQKIISNSNIEEIQKEDAEEAIIRISKLSKQEKNEQTINRIKTRIELLKEIINTVKELAPLATPLLLSLSKLISP